jgi:lipoyl(octanoyl) transferase
MRIEVRWLGRLDYRAAWELQHELVGRRQVGAAEDQLLLVEHPAVLTLGRHAAAEHVRAPGDRLEERGIEVIRVERGGEVTYHGPGQLVAYPIVHLADRGVLLRPFVRVLEAAMADTAAAWGVRAATRDIHPGCWVDSAGPLPRKLGALGLRVERGVTYHGIAFNVTTELSDFELIDPCGMPEVDVTSIARELGWSGEAARPSTGSVQVAAERFAAAFELRLEEARGAASPPEGVARRGAASRPEGAAGPEGVAMGAHARGGG